MFEISVLVPTSSASQGLLLIQLLNKQHVYFKSLTAE